MLGKSIEESFSLLKNELSWWKNRFKNVEIKDKKKERPHS